MYRATALIVALVFASWLSGGQTVGTNTPGTAGTPRPLPHPAVWVAALLVPFVDYLLHQQGR
ncbi:MAG: hypothetical protein M3291_07835 [Actinomycetota bacterium]|nr:hypothetical protein [Actinomycetota bacterium]